MQEIDFFQIVISVATIAIDLTVLGFLMYFVFKLRSTAAILLLISQVMSVILRPLNIIFINYVLDNQTSIEIYLSATQIYILLSYSLFALGIILLFMNYINIEQRKTNRKKYDSKRLKKEIRKVRR